jgi:hypothetical protein
MKGYFQVMENFQAKYFAFYKNLTPKLALQVGADVPEQKYLDRWFGEPLRAIILPTSIFLTNRKGYPTLSLAHQKLVKFFSKVINSCCSNHKTQSNFLQVKTSIYY